jgi:hypothetical protein
MSFKIQIVDQKSGVTFNARYERLDKESNNKVSTVAKAPNGAVVKETTFYGDVPLPAGSTQRRWVDDKGTQYAKSELTFVIQDADGKETPVSEVEQTKVMTIDGYQTLQNYTDTYAICAYYEVFPDDNGMKKDLDRQVAVNANLRGMRKLWEFLRENNCVARGVFCPTSRGFVESDGYIRALDLEGKWGLEIGQFKQAKVFQHLNETVPADVVAAPAAPAKAKVRRI